MRGASRSSEQTGAARTWACRWLVRLSAAPFLLGVALACPGPLRAEPPVGPPARDARRAAESAAISPAEPFQPTRAQRIASLEARARERLEAGALRETEALLEQAYDLDPRPEYLLRVAALQVQQGQPDLAVRTYERILAAPGSSEGARADAQRKLEALTGRPYRVPEPERVLPPRREALRTAGYALLGVGGGALLLGASFAGAALARERELDDVRLLEQRHDLIDEGRALAGAADGCFIAGGLVAATGLVLTLVSLRKRPVGRQARWEGFACSSGRCRPGLVLRY